jgi:hypothetical protein
VRWVGQEGVERGAFGCVEARSARAAEEGRAARIGRAVEQDAGLRRGEGGIVSSGRNACQHEEEKEARGEKCESRGVRGHGRRDALWRGTKKMLFGRNLDRTGMGNISLAYRCMIRLDAEGVLSSD